MDEAERRKAKKRRCTRNETQNSGKVKDSMKLKIKRMVSLLLAVCVMASTAAPVFAAEEPLPVLAVSGADLSEEAAPGELPASTEAPAPVETPVATEAPAPAETPAPTEVPASTGTPVPTETPADSSVPVVEETPAGGAG